ncbi:ribonuclease activity regulator RraA [Zeaxanthinibacter enoshimensis]|uniref:Regulator of RNase E activity RraA n=1 Tax=Zeaxanthinibacter enoshimensis TaxID=392009 RepID=A0A4R6TTY7_9FLAO|nr:ribonuclease activity regulator RraA [Zeaxanthinibacter enoshimensis]TDQ32408.1 regulator of RNase E activity RraA [Zeaxanthinibacter enoshimensis]
MNPITEKLKGISTATIATCLFKKGLRNQYMQGVLPLKKMTANMVGQAYTLRYIPAREDLNPIEVFKDPKHLQRVAVEECPEGHVLVIDSRQNARAASAGSILATRLMHRGVAGLVTDGGFRDSDEIAGLDMPSFHQCPSAPTNLTLHQAIAINDPIGCGDVAVFPGDYLVGDNDGVMVIPQHLAEEVAEECTEMTLYEEYVIQRVAEGESVIGLYPLTSEDQKAAFNTWKARRDNTFD